LGYGYQLDRNIWDTQLKAVGDRIITQCAGNLSAVT